MIQLKNRAKPSCLIQITYFNLDETVINHKRSVEWPTKSGKTQMYANNQCRNTLQRTSLYRYCGNTFDGYSDMMYGCVEDIKVCIRHYGLFQM